MSVSSRKDENSSNVVRIGISNDVLSMVNAVTAKTAIVEFGFGRDLGIVKIVADQDHHPSSYTLSKVSKQSRSLALSCAKIGIEFDESSAIPCKFTEKDGILYMEIPSEIMDSHKFLSSGRLRQHRAEEQDKLNSTKE
jgi:hypothetical protein